MITNIQAIETVYNGYRFRSRLEARWAVFFDTLGIKYEYEKEGFDLGGAGRYLPDFWLPVQKIWAEIKPGWPSAKDMEKLLAFTAAGQPLRLIWGQPYGYAVSSGSGLGMPWIYEYRISRIWREDDGQPNREDHVFAMCRKCHGVNLVAVTGGLDEPVQEYGFGNFGPCCDTDRWPIINPPDESLLTAYEAARQARFEHGGK